MEEETEEDPMPFLILLLTVVGRHLLFRPQNNNRSFAIGKVTTQHVIRLGPSLDYWGSRDALRAFILSKVATIRHISRDHPSIGWHAMFELVLEVLRLGHSPHNVERAF